ncbi:hypothetical protein Hypma_006349 [Hypsizygus marmoreus]|uniref:Uncharacterized protein n=1 Tax=Hypsizygus marmoreus TaxID=39966 RepID=A0A369K217_HYPMA|nr:hypothetical protein Hypma_006349 [Hypsizygus marmoreus]
MVFERSARYLQYVTRELRIAFVGYVQVTKRAQVQGRTRAEQPIEDVEMADVGRLKPSYVRSSVICNGRISHSITRGNDVRHGSNFEIWGQLNKDLASRCLGQSKVLSDGRFKSLNKRCTSLGIFRQYTWDSDSRWTHRMDRKTRKGVPSVGGVGMQNRIPSTQCHVVDVAFETWVVREAKVESDVSNLDGVYARTRCCLRDDFDFDGSKIDTRLSS